MQVVIRLILAAALVLGSLSPAHAGPIIPLVGAVVGFVSSLGVIGQVVLEVGLAVGLSYLAKALAPKPQTPDITQLPGGTSGKLQAGGTVPRSFIVGRGMTAGSLVWANTYGADSAINAAAALSKTTGASGNTPNAYLTQVIALSDIPVSGLAGILVNGAGVTWNPNASPSLEGIAIPEYNSGGKDYLWVRFYDGTQNAADTLLVHLYGGDPNRPYTSARVGTGVAYAVVTALVNDKLFSGFPQFKFVIDGIKLYDRRADSSAGGSGSQRWSDPSTWTLTANPATIIENILRGISYNGQWLYGAQTVSTAQLPSPSWFAAQNECDTAIDLGAGGTEPQFVVGGEIRLDTQPADTIDELLKACNGKLAEIGGSYKIRAGAAGSAVFSFSDEDILSTEKQTFDPFPNLQQTINAVTAKYISPDEGWNAKDAPPLYDSTLEALDGGRRLPVAIDYSFVTSGTQVQRLMKSARDIERAFRHHALPMPPDAFVLEPLDVVAWTSTRNGYSSKLFDILTVDDLANLNVGLSVKEVDPNAYDWTPAVDEQPVSNGTISILRPAAQPIVDWSATAYSITTDSGQKIPAIQLSWDPNTDDVDGVHFEVRLKSNATVLLRDGFTDAVKAGSIIISQNLSFNTQYEVRGQYIPHSPRDVSWSGWLTVTTPDNRLTFAGLEAAIRAYIKDIENLKHQIDFKLGQLSAAAAEQDAQNFIDKARAAGIVQSRTDEFRTGIDANAAAITETQQLVATNEAAFAEYQLTVDARFDADEASITQNATAFATLNESFASFESTVTSRLGSDEASINQNATAVSNLSSSFGQYQVTISAQFGALSASVSQTSNAVATIDGRLQSTYQLKLNANGYVGGFQAYNDGSQVGVIFDVDFFQIGRSGYGAKPIFSAGTINGQGAIGINGNAALDGTFSARALNVGTLTAITANIGSGTVQGSWSAATGSLVVDFANGRITI